MRKTFILAALSVLSTAPMSARADPSDSMLVTTAWVAEHLGDRNLVLLHVGEQKDFDAGHLPGARFLPRDAFATRDPTTNLTLELPSVAALVERLEALGVSNTSRIVLYFGTDWVTPTARAYFTLDYLGLGDRASIMDGGFPAWRAEGRVVSTDDGAPTRGRLTPQPKPEIVADLEFVKAVRSNGGVVILDSRTPQFFSGMSAGQMPRAGHVPGARNIPFDTLVDENDRLKTPDALRRLFREAGVEPGKTVVTYCHIGQQASLGYFVSKYLGYKVRLYDGSFEEWSRHTELPVEGAGK